IDGSFTVYSDCFFESVKQEDQKCNKPGQKFEQFEQQGDGCLGFEYIGEEYLKTEMELNNLQQQQDPSSMFDPTASSSSCFQIPHDQPMFATDHHHQNWVSDSMFG
ncbi:unnamed protein product, partial [Brassica rapa subsp. trilocularis]